MTIIHHVFWKRSLLTAGLLAISGAAIITFLFKPEPLEDKLLHLHISQALPGMERTLENEPVELQLLWVAYAQSPILAAKASLALERHRELARPVLLAYGHEPDFQEVLSTYGEDVVLPIHYFQTNDILTLRAKHEAVALGGKAAGAANTVMGWFGKGKVPAELAVDPPELTPERRGWYAVEALQAHGYNFLGQFRKDEKGQPVRLQSERAVEAFSGFFTSGLVGLDEKVQTGQKVEAVDVAWAGVDLALGIGALKVARLSKGAAKSGQATASSSRSAATSSTLLGQSKLSSRIARYGKPTALTLTAVRHPSVFNSMLGKLGTVLQLPVAAVQMAGWTLALKAILLSLIFLLRPLFWLLASVVRLLGWTYRSLHGKPLVAATPMAPHPASRPAENTPY